MRGEELPDSVQALRKKKNYISEEQLNLLDGRIIKKYSFGI